MAAKTDGVTGLGDGSGRRRVPPGMPLHLPAVLRALGGPVLIVVGVLAVLHSFAFGGMVSIQHPDVLPFFVPMWCFLGKSLAAGHIPAWNPHVMAGVPFAADPQSGWMYLPAMALFSVLPCQLAIRWFIVLQPILAGLGIYWFLRGERVSRPAATVGGVALALGVGGSGIALNLPFAGTFAWTALMLAAASRLVRSVTWPARLTWLAMTSLAWGQLAAAHLSDGMVVGTGALLVYLAFRLGQQVREGRRTAAQALGLLGLLLVSLPLLNLAYLLPRLAYLSRTSLGWGYRRLDILSAELQGKRPGPLSVRRGYFPTFPLSFDVPPGVYLGAIGLGLVFAGWRAPRLRAVAVAFAAFGGLCYVLSLHRVAAALGRFANQLPFGSFYFHDAGRLAFGLILSLAVLAGIGVEAWSRARSWAERALLLLPGIVVWGVLPGALGLPRGRTVLPLVGALAGLAALGAASFRSALSAALPVVLAVELSMGGLTAQSQDWRPDPGLFHGANRITGFNPLYRPTVPASTYFRAGPIARSLLESGDGRYLSFGPELWVPLGYHVRLFPGYWAFMATQRSMLFNLEEAQGYNPAQLRRYWTFVRAAQRAPILYNTADFVRLNPVALNLLQVRYLIQPAGDPPAVGGAVPQAREGRWELDRLPGAPPRASVLTSWTVARSPDEALAAVTSPGFDPGRRAVLERDPGIASGPESHRGEAVFRWTSSQAARVSVDSPAPAIVLVRNSYDPNWRATVDGHRARVLAVDYLDQGIAVPSGRHVVELTYHEPTIGYGLAGSGISMGLLAAAMAFAMRRRRAAVTVSPRLT